jgi:hypothetical protein
MGKCDVERDVPDAVVPLAVFLPDALRDDSDHRVGVAVYAHFASEADGRAAWSGERGRTMRGTLATD